MLTFTLLAAKAHVAGKGCGSEEAEGREQESEGKRLVFPPAATDAAAV